MNFIGNFPNAFTTVPIMFTTADANGQAVAPSAAFVATDVNIYKDGSATQKTTTNGLTMTSPFDSITGLHLLLIDTSNNTGDTGFWASGHVYNVILTPATTTVASQTIVKEIGSFTLDAAVSVASVTGAVGSVTGAVGSVTGAVGSVTGNVGGNVVGSVASVTGNVGGNVVGSVASVTGSVGSVTGNVGGNVVGSVASVTGNVGGNVVGSVGSVVAAVTLNNVQGIKKNTALAKFEFCMFDTSGNPKTGLQASLRTAGNSQASIDGAAFADLTNIATITEISNGFYWVDFAAADLNGTNIAIRFAATGARDLDFTIHTVLA